MPSIQLAWDSGSRVMLTDFDVSPCVVSVSGGSSGWIGRVCVRPFFQSQYITSYQEHFFKLSAPLEY